MKVGAQAALMRIASTALVFGAGLVGNAWGETFNAYRTDSGCKIFLLASNVKQPVQWSGQCSQGLAHGPGVLSYQFDAGALGTARWHVCGHHEGGYLSGVSLSVADPEIRQSNDTLFSVGVGLYRLGIRQKRNSLLPDIQLAEAEIKLAAFVEQALAEGLPTMPLAQLRAALRTWKENPTFDPVAWGAVPPGGSRFTGSTPQGPEDPRVVGRGAKGSN